MLQLLCLSLSLWQFAFLLLLDRFWCMRRLFELIRVYIDINHMPCFTYYFAVVNKH